MLLKRGENYVKLLIGITGLSLALVGFYMQYYYIPIDTTIKIKEELKYLSQINKENYIKIKEYEYKNELINKYKNLKPKDLENIAILRKFNEIDDKIKKIDEKTIALRQAINPFKPDEVLTIARLKDEVSIVKNRLEYIYDALKKDQDNFKSSVVREIEASGKSTYLILLVLGSFALNFLYSAWKDLKEEKKEKKLIKEKQI